MIEIQNVTEVMQHLGGFKAVVFDLDDTLNAKGVCPKLLPCCCKTFATGGRRRAKTKPMGCF